VLRDGTTVDMKYFLISCGCCRSAVAMSQKMTPRLARSGTANGGEKSAPT